MTYYAWKPEYTPGERFTGGAGQRVARRCPAVGALRAIDPATGERKWEFKYLSPSTAGLLTTASGLIFSGDDEGNLLALDSRSGKLLWRYQMGATLHGTSPITYMLDGRQHLLVPAGTTLTAWALPDVARTALDAIGRSLRVFVSSWPTSSCPCYWIFTNSLHATGRPWIGTICDTSSLSVRTMPSRLRVAAVARHGRGRWLSKRSASNSSRSRGR